MLTFDWGFIVICILYSKQVQGQIHVQHDSSKCLEDNGSGYLPDNDCIDCTFPRKQACADNYWSTNIPHGHSCNVIWCFKPLLTHGPHDSSKCLEDNGSGYLPDKDCIDCTWPPKQACADDYYMTNISTTHACNVILCLKPIKAIAKYDAAADQDIPGDANFLTAPSTAGNQMTLWESP